MEYLVYVENPGPVELRVENHSYDVSWFNPADGDELKEKKGYHGEHFTGSPPDSTHDWVLRVSREGTKEAMLKSYKFESRRCPRDEEQRGCSVPGPGTQFSSFVPANELLCPSSDPIGPVMALPSEDASSSFEGSASAASSTPGGALRAC